MSVLFKTGFDVHYHADDSNRFTRVDRSIEVRRLRKNVLSLINTHKGFAHLGGDCLLENFATTQGFKDDELVILLVLAHGRRLVLLTAPEGIWRNPQDRRRLIEIKRQGIAAGRQVILVPPNFIQRQPRLGNSRTIEDSFAVRITAEDRMAVFHHILENGYSNLHDCAAVIRNCEAPYSAVLAMVGMGLFDMNIDAPMSAQTRIDLPSVAA